MAILCAQLAGCGKSAGAPARVSRDDLPTVLAMAACDALATCCQQVGATFDVAACRSAGSARLQQLLDQQLGGPNVTYDSQAAGDCIAGISSATFCGAGGKTSPFDGCRSAFVGMLPPGAACSSAAECARPAQGQADCDLARGVCVQQTTAAASPHGKAGDACAGTCIGNDCAALVVPAPSPGSAPKPWCYRDEGLVCGSTTVCEPLLPKGAPCFGVACGTGLYCDFASSVCVDTKANGQHCNSPYECQSGVCVDPGTCAASPVTQQTCTVGPFNYML
jgi:hypothetical protein